MANSDAEDDAALLALTEAFRQSTPIAVSIDANFFIENLTNVTPNAPRKKINLRQRWLGRLISLMREDESIQFVMPTAWETEIERILQGNLNAQLDIGGKLKGLDANLADPDFSRLIRDFNAKRSALIDSTKELAKNRVSRTLNDLRAKSAMRLPNSSATDIFSMWKDAKPPFGWDQQKRNEFPDLFAYLR